MPWPWRRKLRKDATPEQIQEARETYENDDIQIDDDAEVSLAMRGQWVSAWVWIPRPETRDPRPETRGGRWNPLKERG